MLLTQPVELLPEALQTTYRNFGRAEQFRQSSDYNTGSVSVATGVLLYLIHHRIARVVEVGTFIGKSTSAIAAGVGRHDTGGIVYTCDQSNACFDPWDGIGCEVVCFHRHSSTQMLQSLATKNEKLDLFFFNGRIQAADIPLVRDLSHEGTLYLFDDFEGTEKGVANVAGLRPHIPSLFPDRALRARSARTIRRSFPKSHGGTDQSGQPSIHEPIALFKFARLRRLPIFARALMLPPATSKPRCHPAGEPHESSGP